MKQNSAYLLLYERKEPLETEDFAPHMESRGPKMGGGVEKESKLSKFPSSSMTPEALLSAEEEVEEEVEEEEGEVEGEVQEGEEGEEGVEGEVEGDSEDDGAPLIEDEKAAEEERKRSSDADVMMYRYPSETKGEKGEGDDEGKREDDDDREAEAREEGVEEEGEGEDDAEKESIRRVNFSADSWDEYEIKKDESVTPETVQVHNTHNTNTTNNTHNTHDSSEAYLQPESGIRSRVRTRITDFPPIAKKVLQAVWTENLEFQTDRSLFNRCVMLILFYYSYRYSSFFSIVFYYICVIYFFSIRSYTDTHTYVCL